MAEEDHKKRTITIPYADEMLQSNIGLKPRLANETGLYCGPVNCPFPIHDKRDFRRDRQCSPAAVAGMVKGSLSNFGTQVKKAVPLERLALLKFCPKQ